MPKEFFTYQQQMKKLRSSGLAIEDEEACCKLFAKNRPIGNLSQWDDSLSDLEAAF